MFEQDYINNAYGIIPVILAKSKESKLKYESNEELFAIRRKLEELLLKYDSEVKDVEKMKEGLGKNSDTFDALEDYELDIQGFIESIANNALATKNDASNDF